MWIIKLENNLCEILSIHERVSKLWIATSIELWNEMTNFNFLYIFLAFDRYPVEWQCPQVKTFEFKITFSI